MLATRPILAAVPLPPPAPLFDQRAAWSAAMDRWLQVWCWAYSALLQYVSSLGPPARLYNLRPRNRCAMVVTRPRWPYHAWRRTAGRGVPAAVSLSWLLPQLGLLPSPQGRRTPPLRSRRSPTATWLQSHGARYRPPPAHLGFGPHAPCLCLLHGASSNGQLHARSSEAQIFDRGLRPDHGRRASRTKLASHDGLGGTSSRYAMPLRSQTSTIPFLPCHRPTMDMPGLARTGSYDTLSELDVCLP